MIALSSYLGERAEYTFMLSQPSKPMLLMVNASSQSLCVPLECSRCSIAALIVKVIFCSHTFPNQQENGGDSWCHMF
jgi:hypothetical protein